MSESGWTTLQRDEPMWIAGATAHVRSRIREAVPRKWLLRRLDKAFTATDRRSSSIASNTILVVGTPGTGKSIFAGQLAAHWNCPCYFAGSGSTDGVVWADPKNFLVAIGLQLRALYGSDIFADERVNVRANVRVERVLRGGTVTGAHVGQLSLSAFCRALIEVDLAIGELAGQAMTLKIDELRDLTDGMPPAQLIQDALIKPLRRLEVTQKGERVVIIVDGIDQSPEILRLIPLVDDIPESAAELTWVLLSRPGDHLNRFRVDEPTDSVAYIDVTEKESALNTQFEAELWTHHRLTEAGVISAYEQSPVAAEPAEELIHKLACTSGANFLFLHHLLETIIADASNGKFRLLLSPIEGMPHGLDGIHRYLLTERIRSSIDARDWVEHYVPVLGILGVALAPLTVDEVVKFCGVDVLYVQEVLSKLMPFLDEAGEGSERTIVLFHRSFSEFLFSQDRTRNPYPLRSPDHYHALIADSCTKQGSVDWLHSRNLYALRHLPMHLLQSKQLKAVVELLRGPFAARQLSTIGIAQTRSDCAAVARAAAHANSDDHLLMMLERCVELSSLASERWTAGRYVLDLLDEDPATILDRNGYGPDGAWTGHGEPLLPWSAFLTTERLMDLGANQQAIQLLRNVSRRPWAPRESPKAGSVDLCEGSNFDFNSHTGVLQFLARVAMLEPELALKLTTRLFESPLDQLPNERTGWRDVLRALLIHSEGANGNSVDPETFRALAEVTYQWLFQGGYPHCWAGLTQALFRLLALSVRAEKLDPLWISNVFLRAAERRSQAMNFVQGSRDEAEKDPALQPGSIAVHADILTGMADLLDALAKSGDRRSHDCREPSGTGSSTNVDEAPKNPGSGLNEVLWAACEKITDQLPPPLAEATGGRSLRPAAMAKLSNALHRLNVAAWHSYAEAALETCQADATVPDPSIHSIDQGLAWLRRIDDPEIHHRADRLTRELIANGLQDMEVNTLPEEYGESQARAAAAKEIHLEDLAEEANVYERGRMALRLWREGRASREALVEALAKRSSARRPSRGDEEPPQFADVLKESIIKALVAKTAPWSGELINQLEVARSPERRESVGLDLSAVGANRWLLLEQAEDFETLRGEVETEYERASQASDFNSRLNCCLAAMSFDLMLADRWLGELIDELNDPNDRGLAVAMMLGLLRAYQPSELEKVGSRWFRYLPTPDAATDISRYQTMICESCGRIESFDEEIGQLLQQIANSLPKFWERLQREASEDGSGASTARVEAWQRIGQVLFSVGQVKVPGGSAREQGVIEVAIRASDLFSATTTQANDWEQGAIARNLLKGLHTKEGMVEIQKGAISELVTGVSDDLQVHADKEVPPSSVANLANVRLGVDLAVQLKRANPSWAAREVDMALATWEAEIAGQRDPIRDGENSQFSGLARILGQVFARDTAFEDPDERRLFDLSKSLVDWCTREPCSPDLLAHMQRQLAGTNDANKRKMISAPLVFGAVLLGDTERASALIDATDSEYLELARFYEQLIARINGLQSHEQAELIAELKSITLKLLLETPLSGKNDALDQVLASWLLLRVVEQPRAAGHAYLRELATRLLAFYSRPSPSPT
ncbi:hypothetical protein [Candidatus Nitrospira allomarina]|uniref:Uncharacterized protein n=1 Tax=Candidatus Nitrospira allomarina TaxID=3020900 RepID=A0AA96GJV5_9BACT|nr:hypothetical protein [Candidatus Nitrospira allomarina]WNM59734.1 hypothetical protein PP769_08260 [Candidatus Nitrospira allomarina]